MIKLMNSLSQVYNVNKTGILTSQKIKLMNSLSQVYNVNKTGILLDHRTVWDKEKSED